MAQTLSDTWLPISPTSIPPKSGGFWLMNIIIMTQSFQVIISWTTLNEDLSFDVLNSFVAHKLSEI